MSAAPSAPSHEALPRAGGALGRAARAVFVQDAALKGLAFFLAVLLWFVVRERLETEITVADAAVEVRTPSDAVVVTSASGPRTDVTLRGLRSEVERARAALDAGARVVVRLSRPPPNDPGGRRLFVSPQDFSWPFPDAGIVVQVRPPVEVVWERVSERDVAVRPPTLMGLPEGGIEVAKVVAQVGTVRVRGPASVVERLESLAPDPVDAGPWLATQPDLAVSMPWTSGFGLWRKDAPGSETRSVRVLSIVPDTVSGTANLRQTGAREFEGKLLTVTPPGGAATAWEYSISGGPEYERQSGAIRLRVKGDKTTLEWMDSHRDAWFFAVQLPPPPGPGAPEIVDRAFAVLLVLQDPTRRAALDGAPTVLVTVRAR